MVFIMTNQSLEKLIHNKSCSALIDLNNSYPVPLDKICQKLGIYLSYIPASDDLSGRIYLSNGIYCIEANLRHSEPRRRFTIAHELGHYCLHQEFLNSVGTILERSTRSFVIRDKEIEADEFAAELLMPQAEFTKQYNNLDVNTLAEYFAVSIQATYMRIKALKLN